MIIQNLRLLNFRNYSDEKLLFNNQVNIFTGNNGQGKTNVLEAINLLVTGHSFRSQSNQDLLNKNSGEIDHAWLSSEIVTKDSTHEIVQKIFSHKKETLLDRKKVASTHLRKRMQTVVFSPDSLSVVKEGPAARRQLFEDILMSLSPDKIELVHQFNKCLKTRNRILKNYYEERQSREECITLLASVDKLFIDLAAHYTYAKISVIRMLNERIKATLNSILDDSSVDIYVDYVISGQSAIDWSLNQVYDALYSRLMSLQTAELASGQSLVGPQKHDVRFYFSGQDARTFCSQGQQRAIVLAVKIAQIFGHYEVYKDYPVLLLDDVLSELDQAKQSQLLGILGQINTQIFLTTTEINMKENFSDKKKTIFLIEKGQFKTPGWN